MDARSQPISRIDVRRVRRALAIHGVSIRALARAVGVDPGYLSRSLRPTEHVPLSGATANAILKALTVMNLPAAHFRVPASGQWAFLDFHQKGEMSRQLSFTARAKNIISVTRNCDTFLLPNPMYLGIERSNFRRLGLDEDVTRGRLEYALEVAEARKYLRDHHRPQYRLKVISPAGVFQLAKAQNPFWLDAIAGDLSRHADDTALGVVSDADWATFHRLFRRAVLDVDWVKINVADQLFVSIWTYHGVYFSYENDTVSRVIGVIRDGLVPKVIGGFPDLLESTPSQLAGYCDRTLSLFDFHWRLKHRPK